ncbi:hypothetical protein Fcan01_17931 [Folsomia candida]|uniref:Uncharacterized protein n=1 Tax=Folsomia candida TaxID=158441 RepID=A0A226DQ42_FOLCA|nr:hypothetical protein Fcan01_17931 [Folsomia candida]
MGKTVDLSLTDCKVKNWILPAFSTTTENDVISCGVIFMATMKKYFDYECSFTLCGIPEVVLEGSVADWVEIDKRIDKLREYEGLETWWTMLKEITQQFLAAKEGKVDTSWWSKICDVEYYEGHMSGDPNKSWITGWITTFGYFDVEGNERIPTVMFAGLVGTGWEDNGASLRPSVGWAIALRDDADPNLGVGYPGSFP